MAGQHIEAGTAAGMAVDTADKAEAEVEFPLQLPWLIHIEDKKLRLH